MSYELKIHLVVGCCWKSAHKTKFNPYHPKKPELTKS